jgi:penicillin-binding protein 2
VLESVPPKPGQDVILTLDVPFQSEVEALIDRPENLPAGYGRSRGAAVVIDLASGGILALASAPRYDPNRYEADFPDFMLDTLGSPLLHRATAGQYALGSCFKIVIGTAALHEGAISPQTVFHCAHALDPARPDRFTCLGWHGDIRVRQAYCVSCNVFFYHTAMVLGRDDLVAWARRFGYGHRLGLLGVTEAPGLVSNRTDVRNLAIGQGELMVTPLQAARMVALAATDGRMWEVHLVRSPRPADRPLHRVDLGLRSELMEVVREGLTDVVNHDDGTYRGSGYRTVRSDQVTIAGKTGSPEVGEGRPTHSWFVGYAPAERPQIAFAVVFEKAGHGPTVAGPVARKIVETALKQKLITTDR